jgi:hypothetical protein
MFLWMEYSIGVQFPNDPTTIGQFILAKGTPNNPARIVWDSALQDRYEKGEIYLEMNGRFDYRDAAGNPHWTQICNILAFPDRSVPLDIGKDCVAHNNMDNNK